jgi:tetratricopeptide (TPR) repeat protein
MSASSSRPSSPDSFVPGVTPAVVWGVPFERNPHFTGRAKSLDQLREALLTSRPGVTRGLQVIAGLGGIGKTQLALEYCYKHRMDYAAIWWINAEEPTTVALGFAKLARALGMSFPIETPLDEIRHVLRRVLGQRHDWLIVFDNAAGLEAIRNYMPVGGGGGGHVVVTTRNAEWGESAAVTQLGRMTRSESIAFLRKRTERKDANEVASKLAQAVGDLPLALEQAAAVINESRIGFADYLARFETHWAELLTRGRGAGDYPDSVAMTWEISFRAVEEDAPAAAQLLYFASCLGPDPIRRHFLMQSYAAVPGELQSVLSSEESLDEAIRMLSRFSLVEVQGDAIVLHRLVSGLTRNRLTDEERAAWLDAALRRVGDAFDFQSADVGTWAACAELVGKALAVARYAEAHGVALVRVAGLLDSVGRYLLRTAQFEQARQALGRAMAIYEGVCGERHAKVAAVANNLGRVLTRLGENEQARWCFERALEIDRAAYGEDDPHVATVANNYGLALHACGRVEDARAQFEFALRVYDRHYGDDHPKTASVLNNLGFVSAQLGDFDAAVEHFQRALAVAEASHGANHPVIGSILSNLGDARRRRGDFEQARGDLVRALQIDESAYGPVHPDIARDLQRLGELLRDTGDQETARVLFERALAIDEQVYGPDHVLLIHRLNPLAQLLRATGELEESQRYFERAVRIYRESRPEATTAAAG